MSNIGRISAKSSKKKKKKLKSYTSNFMKSLIYHKKDNLNNKALWSKLSLKILDVIMTTANSR